MNVDMFRKEHVHVKYWVLMKKNQQTEAGLLLTISEVEGREIICSRTGNHSVNVTCCVFPIIKREITDKWYIPVEL